MAFGFKSPQKKTKSSKALSIASANLLTEKIREIFSEVEDPRVERTRIHRTGHAPQNLSKSRRIAINALNLEQSIRA